MIFFPDEDDDESDEDDRPQAAGATVAGRWARRALYGLSGLVVAAALVWGYGLVARATSPVARPRAVAPSPPVAVPAVPSGLDRLSDAVGRAVLGYNERARMFDKEQLDCSDLALGLVAVEESWMAYNTARRDNSVPLTAPLAARDQQLATSVDGVERHFDRSECERP